MLSFSILLIKQIKGLSIKTLNQDTNKLKFLNQTQAQDISDNEITPYIEPRITNSDNNPSLDHVIVENHRFYSNKQAKIIPKTYRPEETTYQETDNYVVSNNTIT